MRKIIVLALIAVVLGGLFIIPEKSLSGLQVSQHGMSLDIEWHSFSKDNKVIVDGKEYRTDENFCNVPIDKVPHTYDIMVVSYGGFFPKVAEKKIHAVKLEQFIDAKERYALVEGKSAKIKAAAEGKLSYETDDKNIKIKNGKIKAVKAGNATIKIKASENEQFKEASRDVTVKVYPKTLKKPVLEIKSDNRISCSLTYEKVPYGAKYTVLKDGKKCDKDKCLRDGSHYTVVAETKECGIKAESAEIVLEPYSQEAETYDEPHLLSTLERGDFLEVASVSRGGLVPQSFCKTDKEYIVSFTSRNGKEGFFVSYDFTGKEISSHKVDIGHGNGATYCPETKRIYTVKTHNKTKSDECTMYDVNGEDKYVFELPGITSGIAYDDGKFILSKGSKLEITDSDFEPVLEIEKVRYKQAQDIGAGNGVIMVAMYSGKSYVDIYRTEDGEYLGGYEIPFGEVESVLSVDKHLVVLMHNTEFNGTRSGKILISKKQFELL